MPLSRRTNTLDGPSGTMARWARRLGLVLGLVAVAAPAFAAQDPAASRGAVAARLTIPTVTVPPTLDDYLGDHSGPGLPVTTFLQRAPKDLAPATEQTTAYLSYDASNLYVAFVCRTVDRTKIRARMEKREDIFADDFVGVMLDTFHDKQRAYLFFANPLGVQADGITAAAGDDYSFDTEWHSNGKLTDAGYVALLSIPFKSLRFPGGTGGVWGVGLIRAMPSSDETDFWPAITNRINGFVAQFGEMDAPAGISPGHNVQLTPYGTFSGARVLEDGATGYGRPSDARVGFDGKAVIHSALTADFTVNPDFSQVESDNPQVTVNQRFEVFFPEKRPFFLENSDYFNDTLQTLVFTRRIRDPQVGGRLTGKVGSWALGALVADDRAPGASADSGGDGSGRRAVNGAFRARRDFGGGWRVGVLGTTHAYAGASNNVAAVDARLQFSPTWVLSVQSAASRSAAAATTSGESTVADLSRSGRKFSDELTYIDASPNFEAGIGFVPRTDFRQVTNYFQIRHYPKAGPVISFGPNSYVQATWDYGGALEDWIVRLPYEVDFKGQTFVFYRHTFIQETVSGVRLREREDLAQFGTSFLSRLTGNITVSHGTRPNYDPAPGLLPFLATFTDISGELIVKPIAALSVDETYFYSTLAARSGLPGHGAIFTNPISRTRVNYQFSREWSLRAILDYQSLLPDATLASLGRSRHAGVDILLTWLLHPGTALYVGYSDVYDNVRLDPIDGVVPTLSRLSSTGRQVFVKTSWRLRL